MPSLLFIDIIQTCVHILKSIVLDWGTKRIKDTKLPGMAPNERSIGELSSEQADTLATMFRALGDANRLRLIYACLVHGSCVQDLASRFGLSSSLVSHNLRILKTLRLMRADRRGKRVFYTVDDDHIRDVLSDMIVHVSEDSEHRRISI